MKINERQRKSMECNENQCKSMKINICRYQEIAENEASCMVFDQGGYSSGGPEMNENQWKNNEKPSQVTRINAIIANASKFVKGNENQ